MSLFFKKDKKNTSESVKNDVEYNINDIFTEEEKNEVGNCLSSLSLLASYALKDPKAADMFDTFTKAFKSASITFPVSAWKDVAGFLNDTAGALNFPLYEELLRNASEKINTFLSDK